MIIKEYQTPNEARIYLTEKTSTDIRLSDLQQLERVGKIKPIIYLADILCKDPLKEELLIDKENLLSGYFIPNGFLILDRLAIDDHRDYLTKYCNLKEHDYFKVLNITEYYFNPLKVDTAVSLFCINEHDELTRIRKLTIKSILIKTSELNALVASQNTLNEHETIHKLNLRIDELESQLKDQEINQCSTLVKTYIDEGQGDTLLILGAVMQCIKSIAKNNYTQQALIDAIIKDYPNTKSISQSTLGKKFAKAKTHLNQNVIP